MNGVDVVCIWSFDELVVVGSRRGQVKMKIILVVGAVNGKVYLRIYF